MYLYVVRGVRGLTRSPRLYRNFLLSFLQLSIWIDRQVLNTVTNTVTNAVNVLNREKEEDTGIRILNKRKKKGIIIISRSVGRAQILKSRRS